METTTRTTCNHFAHMGQWCSTPGEVGETIEEGNARVKREERNRKAREKRAWVKEQTRVMKEQKEAELKECWTCHGPAVGQWDEDMEMCSKCWPEPTPPEVFETSIDANGYGVDRVSTWAKKQGWTRVVSYYDCPDYWYWEEGYVFYLPDSNSFAAYFDYGNGRCLFAEEFEGANSMTYLKNLKEAEVYLRKDHPFKTSLNIKKALKALADICK